MNKTQFLDLSEKTSHHKFFKLSLKIHDKIVKRLMKYKTVKIKHSDILDAKIMDTLKSLGSNNLVQSTDKKALSTGMEYAIKKDQNSKNSKISRLSNIAITIYLEISAIF